MSIKQYLLPEDVLANLVSAHNSELVTLSGIGPQFVSNRELGFAMALEHLSERLPKEHQDPLKIFYSRVYWLNRFADRLSRMTGPDAGLEQQVFAILEQAPSEVDWSVVEGIVAAAKDQP